MKKIIFAALVFFVWTGAYSQVTIGGKDLPKAGAILDLNSTAKGGLVLSNVDLSDLGRIPANFGGVAIPVNKQDENSELTGAMVYNTNTTTGVGVYIWQGCYWKKAGGGDNAGGVCDGVDYYRYDPATSSEIPHRYSAHTFGAAGCWMTENLATTIIPEGGNIPQGMSQGSGAIYYAYPGGNTTNYSNNPKYGLLYTWEAAIRRPLSNEDEGAKNHCPHRGICPLGWHIPSDYEWSELEREIASNPAPYSSQAAAYAGAGTYNFFAPYVYPGSWRPDVGGSTEPTFWGRQMRNASFGSGSSKASDAGGFDILPAGVAGGGSYEQFGIDARFHTSSTYAINNSYMRHFYRDFSGVEYIASTSHNMQSVRCKRD